MLFKRGFTIVEVMVVIVVISIVASVIFVGSQDSGRRSRDAQRKTDLKALQTAVELYKLKYGRYPAGCRGTTANTTGTNHISTNQNNHWSGHSGSFACASGNQYIIDLAPEFIPVLPVDPKINPTNANSGYVYTTNNDYTVYKIMALDTVESESVNYDHELFRCGKSQSATSLGGNHACYAVPNNFTGNFVYNSASQASQPSQCITQSIYSNDYAVIGGYSDGDNLGGTFRTSDRAREYSTDIIHCK